MKREIVTTGDGSVSIYIPELDEQYHSKHGAINEAVHVFIKMGLHHYAEISGDNNISILEIGFGTGLNAFLTLIESEKQNIHIQYTGVDAYPVTIAETSQLNYPNELKASQVNFNKMHEVPWETLASITPQFSLKKEQLLFAEIKNKNEFDIVYFDAFGSRVHPEMWEETAFATMYNALKKGGILVTYAAKGSARRAMQAVGFKVERLPGPPGKREMLRATKQ
ncbi:MAG: tRNA (5-methylaminomethyl-2-thiouridine)(34)-methyltransferase MnmD [Patiriisocius sp.]|uniref:tRNA (5-methylaminomethyl-2-thiouridine)(34)-methyltransferase MnmD n=1 Tax=Patiriisocius sp. TaxID=2822396 RepID=UPI003EF62032